MEEINKNSPLSNTSAPSKPTSESTEASLEFELISKKDKKFPFVWFFIGLLIVISITVAVLIYLKIINPSSLF